MRIREHQLRLSHARAPALGVGVLLFAVVIAVFGRATGYDFTGYDEKNQLLRNPLAHSLAPANVGRIFTRLSMTSYYPVRLLSFAADHAVWGMTPSGFHRTNLLFHAANVLLVYALALRLLADEREPGRSRRLAVVSAGLAVALFAVHPVVVEPVAWIAGREELLMVFFTLLAAHAHLGVHETASEHRPGPASPGRGCCLWRHLATGLSGAMACLSNAVGAIVPALITAQSLIIARRSPRRALAGTWYLWLIGAATVIIKQYTERVARTAGTLTDEGLHLGPLDRVLTVVATYGRNVAALIWPKDLVVRYPNIAPDGFDGPVLLGLIALAGSGWLVWRLRGNRVCFYGLTWFLLALAPSSQVVAHHVFRADRFLYLPLVGLAIAAAGTLRSTWRCRPLAGPAMAFTAAILMALAVRSWLQLPVWRDGVSLFEHHVRLFPNEALGYYNRGNAYLGQQRYEEAAADFTRAMSLKPRYAEACLDRGTAYARQRMFREAIADYSQAIAWKGNDAEAYFNRGTSRLRMGDAAAAIADFDRALALRPDFAEARLNRGVARTETAEYHEAVEDLSCVIDLQPGEARPYYLRACSLLRLGEIDRALADFTRAVTIRPDEARTYHDRGVAHAGRHDYRQARNDWTRAAELDPDGEVGRSARENLRRLDAMPEAKEVGH